MDTRTKDLKSLARDMAMEIMYSCFYCPDERNARVITDIDLKENEYDRFVEMVKFELGEVRFGGERHEVSRWDCDWVRKCTAIELGEASSGYRKDLEKWPDFDLESGKYFEKTEENTEVYNSEDELPFYAALDFKLVDCYFAGAYGDDERSISKEEYDSILNN